MTLTAPLNSADARDVFEAYCPVEGCDAEILVVRIPAPFPTLGLFAEWETFDACEHFVSVDGSMFEARFTKHKGEKR